MPLQTLFYWAGWQVQFVEADLKTRLLRQFTFAEPETIGNCRIKVKRWELQFLSDYRQSGSNPQKVRFCPDWRQSGS